MYILAFNNKRMLLYTPKMVQLKFSFDKVGTMKFCRISQNGASVYKHAKSILSLNYICYFSLLNACPDSLFVATVHWPTRRAP